ncbi:hypothetical protein Q5O24_13705 [Eubacteriaceae bacterium ES3]|nr:hypothetical protein Q5O24_13705 [Eubacteriaceae bacterium ES3]
MKKFLYLLLALTFILLIGCTPKSENNGGAATDSATDTTVTTTSENAFAVNYFEYEENQYSYFETTHDEIITAINAAVTEAGYPLFVLEHTYVSDKEFTTNSYYYEMEGRRGQLDIQDFPGNQKLNRIYLAVYNDEAQLEVDRFLMETIADLFVPGQGKVICQELNVYNVTSADAKEFYKVTKGTTAFYFSSDEFAVIAAYDGEY